VSEAGGAAGAGETRYASSGDVSIAYQVTGAGPLDLLFVPGIVSHVEAFHALPGYTRLVAMLGRFARVITFDKRGNGLSDRVAEAPSLYERIDDVRAVLDAVGSRQTALFGLSEGAAMSILFAAEHPDRVAALVLFGAFARTLAAPDYGAGFPPDFYEQFTAETVAAWGTGAALTRLFGPSLAGDEAVRAAAARCERASATPTTLRQLWRMCASIDVRDALARVRAPTLVMHRKDDRVVSVASSRYIAERVRGARLVELAGDDHFPFVGDLGAVVDEIASAFGTAPGPPAAAPPAPTVVVSSGDLYASAPDLASSDLERLVARASRDDFEPPVDLERFVVLRPLGQGGMGAVFLARDRDLGRPVALKVLRTRDLAALRRFRREATAIARLSHPNVVQLYEFGLDASAPYLVMEYVAGGTLAQAVPGPVDWRRACRLVLGAARGLGAAHAVGVVHRDVKPANLLLVDPDGDVVKVADFGLAKLTDGEPLTHAGAVLGTLGYLSPEQAIGRNVDARADVYGLGVVFFRLLCGHSPFSGTPSEMLAQTLVTLRLDPLPFAPPGLPAAVAGLLGRMTALEPAHRPHDANAVVSELEPLVGP
jgi:pimeloyl-ACP methyl ester carboxylesterase